ncbi:MAG TPA: hypothetical protein DCP69_06605, partial [Candidatus Omnitrophica bacterium]|nr:hypothetical protein [Candidatus Omnitrophota bacterium]
MELGDLVEVVVVGDDLGRGQLGELDQLGVDLGHVGHLFLMDVHIHMGLPAQLLEDVQAPAPAVALDGIIAIGDGVELPQDKPGNQQPPLEEPGLA